MIHTETRPTPPSNLRTFEPSNPRTLDSHLCNSLPIRLTGGGLPGDSEAFESGTPYAPLQAKERATRYGIRRDVMLFTLAVILLIAWLLGVVGTYTIGAFVHVLLVIALVLFLVGLINGRRTVV